MAKIYILAHDMGTTGDKATLIDSDSGAPVASAFEPYPTAYRQAGWAEQDPADWQGAVVRGTQRLLQSAEVQAGDIAAISFSGTMNGAVLVDAEGAPAGPALIWADVRAAEQAALLAERCGMWHVYERTGCRPSASCTAAKVLWLKQHRPHLYARAAHVLQCKDYGVLLLTGTPSTDYSDASGTNLFDIERRVWDTDIIQTMGLEPGKFPPVRASTDVVGTVTRQAAAQTGLLAGTPVVAGGGDGACATVGAGCTEPLDAYCCLGSSAWIALTLDRPLRDPRMRTITWMHLDPRYYYPLGVMQCAGGAFDWLERLLRGEDGEALYARLDEAAGRVPPGADGLLFLPYLIGERSPYWDRQARGAFVGLSMAHGRSEITRAVLEGVALNLRLSLDAFTDQGFAVQAMRLIGGGARSAAWRQILADVFGLPILRPALPTEATALGAAIAGGVGVGLYPDFGVAKRLVRSAPAEVPFPAAVTRYAEVYPLFQEAYLSLVHLFHVLSLPPRDAATPAGGPSARASTPQEE
jgi:xylulokinase